MPWWFFGKKKEEKPKEQPPQQQQEAPKNPEEKLQIQKEQLWMYEYLVQYLTSPVWKIPIYNFIDEHCSIFDDEEENKFEYTKIHKQFKDQIEAMIQQLYIDVGLSEEQLFTMVQIGLKNKHHRKIFEQILIIDNFLVFKKLMVNRNKELEFEAMKEIDQHEKASGKQNEQTQLKMQQRATEKEKSELELAIEVSLAAQKEIDKMQNVENSELEQALLQSKLQFQEEETQRLTNSKIVQEKEKPAPVPVSEVTAKPQEKPQEQVQDDDDDLLELDDEPQEEVKQPEEPIPVQQVQQPEPEAKKPEVLKPVIEKPKKIGGLGGMGSLPPLENPNKTLPPLQTKPKYDAPINDLLLQKEQLEKDLQKQREAEALLKNAAVPEVDKPKEESLEDRKKRLLAQREIIRKKKQQERDEELKRFQQLGQQDTGKSTQQAQQELKTQQSIALDLEKSQPKADISEEERQRRLKLYSKLKQNMQ